MPRRSPVTRRPTLESLEIRCNPAALVPFAESLPEPPPAIPAGTALASVTDLIIDPFNPQRAGVGRYNLGDTVTHEVGHWAEPAAANNGGISKLGSKLLVIQGDGNYDTNDDNNHGTHVAGTIGAGGNNTVSGRITAIAVDPSDPVGHAGDDWLSGGDGQDATNRGAASGTLYVGTDRGVYIGGAGRDVLLGGAGQDATVQHELGHVLGFRHEHTRPENNSPAPGDVDSDGFDDIITGATVNGHIKSIGGAGQDDLLGGDSRDVLASGYVKIKTLTSG